MFNYKLLVGEYRIRGPENRLEKENKTKKQQLSQGPSDATFC